MNINGFVVLPGSKTGMSVRLKAKTVRELQLEKAQLEAENKEMEKKLRQLQSKMRTEKEERRKSSTYHWKSGQAQPMAVQAQVLSQSKENKNKVSSGKVKFQKLKEEFKEPVKKPFKHEKANAAVHDRSERKGLSCGLREIKSALVTEANMRVGKLGVVDNFVKKVNLNELKINHELKKVNSKHLVTSDKLSSLLLSAGSAEEPSSEPTCTGLENQSKGLLLNGTFNEEESAKSFQEALIQWRKNNCDHREELRASEVQSDSVGICEVQTNLTVTKEPIHIEFKKGGLSYMEKLLLKKYRRTPLDQIFCSKGVRPVQTLSLHPAVTGGGEEGDDDGGDDDDDVTVDKVKRYWASIFREEVPNPIPESTESSLKIEFLDEPYGKDFEESSNFLLMDAGAMGMNKQGKAEPLKQFGRNPASSKEVSQEKKAVCSHLERNAVQKDSIKLKTMRRSLSSCKLPEKISNPTELRSNKYLLQTQLQKPTEDSQELDSACSSQSANPKQVMLEAHSSPCADCSPVDSSTLFPGDGKWVTEKSLSEYVDDSVVQGVLESQLNKPSDGLETHDRISPLMAAGRSYSGKDPRRAWLTNTPHCKLTGNCPTKTQPRPKSSPMRIFRVDSEIPKHKCLDVTKQGEHLREYTADQEVILNLGKELQSYTGPEKHYSLTSEDLSTSCRHSEKILRNTTDFHKNLHLKDHSRADDTLGGLG